MIGAIIELSGQHGYQALSIAQISARAGVSRATFYEQFADREACLLAAYETVAAQTLARMRASLQAGDWYHAARPAFHQLLEIIQADPDAGRLMFVEALTGGPRLREHFVLVLDVVEHDVEALLEGAPAGGQTLDVPARALIGAVRHVVSRHLRKRSEDRLTVLADDLIRCMACYVVPAGQPRWSIGPQSLLAQLPASLTPAAPAPLPALPRGRHGLPAAAVARSQRTRILVATAAATSAKGYANTTVADIVAEAGVAKEAFYRHFADKEQAFLEAQRHANEAILDRVAEAYFSAEQWPARVWQGLRRLLELIAESPTFSHLRLIEAYRAGAASTRLADGMSRSFSIFIEEGYHYRRDAEQLPKLCSQFISGAILETIQREVALGDTSEILRRLPQLAYLAIAPFAGPADAARLVRELSAAG
ncbi:MAG TPA: helix-turn-helix domain-containing protein [Solirubrobacteraceae bacterium]